MNIALDVDGVLWDIENFQLTYGEKYFKKKGMGIADPNGFGIKDTFACSDWSERMFWARHLLKSFFAKTREHAKAIIKDFRQKGNCIYIVTSRAGTTKTSLSGVVMRHLLKAWLKRNAIEYDEIVFCNDFDAAQNKKVACQRLAVDVIVEDRKENIELLKEITHVIGFRTRNNQFYQDPKVVFVNSFQEIKKEIEQFDLFLKQKKKGGPE